MKKTWLRPIQITKYLVAVFLFLVLILIGKNFISRSFKRPKSFQTEGKITQQKVENREGVRHMEYSKGRLKLQVTTEKYYKGVDDLYHLEGNSEIVFTQAAEGEDIVFSGTEIIHDEELQQFRLNGNARVKYKDLVAVASFFEYEAEEDLLKSDSGVTFTADRIEGSAAKIRCWIKKERIVLQDKVELRLLLDLDSSPPLLAYGNELDYFHKEGLGTLLGKMKLFFGKSEIFARKLEFDLVAEKDSIKSLNLSGNIRAVLITENEVEQANAQEPGQERAQEQGTDAGENEDSLLAPSEKREIRARQMSIRNFQDPLQVRRLLAKGRCQFFMEYISGNTAEIRAASMECILNRKGELRKFKASQNVEMVEKGRSDSDSDKKGRLIQGETLIIERKRSLEIKGGKKTKAKIMSGDFSITSQHIRMMLESENVISQGGVSVVLGPREEQQEAVGFFSKEQQVFIRAEELRYLKEKKRFSFKDNVKVWQGKDMLETKELTLFLDSGKILSSQGTRSVFVVKPQEDKEEEQIEVQADTMGFNPDQAQIYYEKKCSLKVRDVLLTADAIILHLNKDDGEMLFINANSNVVIQQGSYDARGKEAIYDVKQETITLTGQPVLTDKDQGKTEGDKLTFNLADGRIFVENKDRKRSKTAIKK